MPRIRSLKPEHPRNRKIGKLSDRAYRLWVSLVNQADDEGRHLWDPEEFRVLIWGYQPKVKMGHIELAMQEVMDAGLCVLYRTNARIYYELHDWAVHQPVDHASASDIPGCHSPGTEILSTIRDHSRVLARTRESSGNPREDEVLCSTTTRLHSPSKSKRSTTEQHLVLLTKEEGSEGTPEQWSAADATVRRASEAQVLLDFWFRLYGKLFGQSPQVEGARDMLAAKALLSGRTLEQAQAIVRFHLEHPAGFYAERKLFGIHHIRKDCNQIIARMSSPTAGILPKATQQTVDAVKRWKELGRGSRK